MCIECIRPVRISGYRILLMATRYFAQIIPFASSFYGLDEHPGGRPTYTELLAVMYTLRTRALPLRLESLHRYDKDVRSLSCKMRTLQPCCS